MYIITQEVTLIARFKLNYLLRVLNPVAELFLVNRNNSLYVFGPCFQREYFTCIVVHFCAFSTETFEK